MNSRNQPYQPASPPQPQLPMQQSAAYSGALTQILPAPGSSQGQTASRDTIINSRPLQTSASGARLAARLARLKHSIVWVIVGVLGFMVIGLIAFVLRGLSSVTFDDLVPYSNQYFSIQQPESWLVTEENLSTVFEAPTDTDASVAVLEVTKLANPLFGYASSSESKKDGFIEELRNLYADSFETNPPPAFATVTQSSFVIGKHPAATRSISFTVQGVSPEDILLSGSGDILITDSGEVYILFAAAEKNVWDLNSANFETVLNSFVPTPGGV